MSKDMSTLTRRLRPVLKPLGKTEEGAAIRLAMADLLAEPDRPKDARFRVLGAELAIEKPPRPEAVPTRAIAVLIADYANRRHLRFLVEKNKLTRRDGLAFEPAFHIDEIREGRRIAERDRGVAAAARTRGAFASPFSPAAGGEPGVRLIGLRYAVARKGKPTAVLGTAVVDLSAAALISFERFGGRGREG